ILKTPVRTPVANAFAERWIGSIRRELLDRTMIWSRRQLERLVTDYIAHYNQHRPHRSLAQRAPTPKADPLPTPPATVTVRRTTRCEGLINEYRNAG
ncbi:MAG: integrase core domain-containing protein, partial [Actinomycetota bacterium]|nr:integrase core domain-containing protein [Actinomycetota bacterium]